MNGSKNGKAPVPHSLWCWGQRMKPAGIKVRNCTLMIKASSVYPCACQTRSAVAKQSCQALISTTASQRCLPFARKMSAAGQPM